MISWIGHNNDHHCYISNHCAIKDDDEVVLTGGVGSAKMATVTKYNVKGEATSLLSLLSRMWKIYLCGPRDGESGIMMISVVVNNYLQIYIVTGGTSRCEGMLARTEILKKNGGTTWKIVAYLPTARTSLSGVSLPNGHFLVAGGRYSWRH